MGASRADAEDAAQEAVIKAWQQWESIREPAAWIRSVAIRSYWKQSRRERYETLSFDGAVEPATEPDLGIFAEEQRRVLSLLRALPPGQRAVAALYYDGLTCEEIAELLYKTPATVRSHLRYARRTLKELMATGDL